MGFKELLAAFAARYGIDGLDVADGVAELKHAEDAHAKATETGDSHHNMISSGYFHV